MKTKICIILILITAIIAIAYFYTTSKDTSAHKIEVTQSPTKDPNQEAAVETSELPNKDPETRNAQNLTVNTDAATTTENSNEDIVKLIDSLEQNGALSINEIQNLMSDPDGFDQALYKLEESYYEPEYSYETKVKYQHFFNTSPFHLQGKAQLSNLQCSPKMCLAKVTGIKKEQLTEYPQSIQSSEDLPIKALAIGFSDTHVLLAFSTDPEVNTFMTRKQSD